MRYGLVREIRGEERGRRRSRAGTDGRAMQASLPCDGYLFELHSASVKVLHRAEDDGRRWTEGRVPQRLQKRPKANRTESNPLPREISNAAVQCSPIVLSIPCDCAHRRCLSHTRSAARTGQYRHWAHRGPLHLVCPSQPPQRMTECQFAQLTHLPPHPMRCEPVAFPTDPASPLLPLPQPWTSPVCPQVTCPSCARASVRTCS